MRKLVLWLMFIALVIVPCSADASTAQIGSLGIFRNYSTNGEVRIVNGKADYSNVTRYDGGSLFLGTRLKGTYTEDMQIPSGILFTGTEQDGLTGYYDGEKVRYDGHFHFAPGERLRWILNTSPATIGSMTIPDDAPDIGDIVPYVKMIHDEGGSKIMRVMVCFAESEDVAGSGEVKPVVHFVPANLSENDYFTVRVYFEQGNNTYSWRFLHSWQYYEENEGYTIWQRDKDEYGPGEPDSWYNLLPTYYGQFS